MKYWNKTYECMSREDLKSLQLERLQNTVARVYSLVPFYRDKLQALGVGPEDIKSLDDIRRLPFTYKDDLRENYPYGLLAEPLSQRAYAPERLTRKCTLSWESN